MSELSRIEALKEARVMVRELYDVRNDKGYPRFTGGVNDVLSQELRVAAFLLGGDDE